MVPIRSLAGVALFDLPRWAVALSGRPGAWVRARNRRDRLEVLPGEGARVDGEFTSALHAAAVVPCLGRSLYARALHEHPIVLRDAPAPAEGSPRLSVVIGHRGPERLPHLLLTLRSLSGQSALPFECVVVEQSPARLADAHLPAWVRYVHQEWPEEKPFGRSHALNFGARHARGEVLLFHDNDMLVPVDYLERTLRAVDAGFEIVNLKRFVFYLDEATTRETLAAGRLPGRPGFDAIVQNLLAGGSVAATLEAYDRIGGFDERFLGWGWEDNEFWERAQTRRVYSWGSLPVVHLWHPAQPDKGLARATSESRAAGFRSIPVEERIERLRAGRAASEGRAE